MLTLFILHVGEEICHHVLNTSYARLLQLVYHIGLHTSYSCIMENLCGT